MLTPDVPASELSNQLLDRFAHRFSNEIVPKHIERTKLLANPNEFDINPFLTPYLSAFATGEVSRRGMAEILVTVRALGPSITTSFGANMQKFMSDDLVTVFGSTTAGIDIEFVDQVDFLKKYAQVKLGPNTINRDDVATIDRHFHSIKNLSRTNNLALQLDQLIVGVVYGQPGELSMHYRSLRDEYHYPVFVGAEFWRRLTGDESFYEKLIAKIVDSVHDIDSREVLKDAVDELSESEALHQLEALVRRPM